MAEESVITSSKKHEQCVQVVPVSSSFCEEVECPICFEPLPKINKDDDEMAKVILDISQLVKCGHVFHQSCLGKHEEEIRGGGSNNNTEATCPMCRIPLMDDEGKIMARTTNGGGEIGYHDLLDLFLHERFYRDNPDMALQEVMTYGEDVETILDLLKQGVDINSTTPEGQSGLHYAVMNGRLPVVQCYIDNNINVNAVSHFGDTAMDNCEEMTNNNKEEIKAILEQARALRREDICANCGVTTTTTSTTTMTTIDNSLSPSPTRMQRCSRCEKVYYCSRVCQKQQWKEHREFCNKYQDMA